MGTRVSQERFAAEEALAQTTSGSRSARCKIPGSQSVMSELFDAAEVRKALARIIKSGAVFEVRALDATLSANRRPATISGYFDNPDACVAALKKLAGAVGIYITINPVDPALLARCANRLDYAGRNSATGDQHILQRTRFLIDVDPVRASGISATSQEKEAAHKKALAIYAYLKERGWPEPVVADSGNGYHLIYRIDLPCDDGKLLEQTLTLLADRFDGDGVKIDRTVFNPARIVRLYGTLACKGDNTKDRPHRLSKILRAPLQRAITAEKLRALVDELKPAAPPPAARQAAHSSSFDVERFLAQHRVAVAERSTETDGTIKWRLDCCVFNPDHENPDAAVFQFPDGKLGYKCFHTSCVDKHWNDFRRHFEPDYDSPKATVTSSPGEETGAEVTSLTSFDLTPYPAPLSKAAFHGLAGDFVERVFPCTEADRGALLFTYLVTFGNVIGRTAHAIADGAPHYCNLNVMLVGPTSKARKGSARWHTNRLFNCVDQEWIENCIASGLSSGEGLIWEIRDPIKKMVKNKETGEEEFKLVDPGKKDKRLLVIQTEFGSTLKVMEREGNNLSAMIRAAWDCEPKLRSMTKNSPVCATNPHISIIGHITVEELRPGLSQIEAANGFGNRFLWPPVKRSKELPEGGELPAIADLIEPLKKAVDFAKNLQEPLKRDEAARELWASIYHDLSAEKPGLFGAITARSEAQALRFSDIYALLDCAPLVGVEHLQAALECWRYCEDGVRWCFRTGTGNKNADRILAALAAAGQKGLTKRQIIVEVFNRNATKFEIDDALRLLHRLKLALRQMEDTATRPAERWFLNRKVNEQYEQSTPEDPKNRR
jgi:hypothetical protein